jgi:hypothetical protein
MVEKCQEMAKALNKRAVAELTSFKCCVQVVAWTQGHVDGQFCSAIKETSAI